MLKTVLREAGTRNQMKSWIYTKDWRESEMINTGKNIKGFFPYGKHVFRKHNDTASGMQDVCRRNGMGTAGHVGTVAEHQDSYVAQGKAEPLLHILSQVPLWPVTQYPQVLPWPPPQSWCHPELSPVISTQPCPYSFTPPPTCGSTLPPTSLYPLLWEPLIL